MASKRLSKDFLDETVTSISDKKRFFSMVFSVEHGSSGFSYTQAGGNMESESSYFIASVTKLYMTVVIMNLVKRRKVKLEDPMSHYLPEAWVKGINVYKGVDYSSTITLKHLLSNTSGVPDYFFHKNENGNTFADELLLGNDISWNQDETIEYVKNLKPKFPPGKKGKVAYSDTNYQLLGKIIEEVTGKGIADVLREEVFDVLDLKNTYAYTNTDDQKPVPFYYKSKELWVPKYIASVTAEGGIVSTAEDMMCFLKAFFNGGFLTHNEIQRLKQWNLILPPPSLFYYGIGLEKLYVPRIISPLKPINEIIGFWGQTGSFAWHHPETNLYFTGTTNQIDGSGHSAVMKAMVKIIKAAR